MYVFSPGVKVVCIHNEDVEDQLTEGKIYTVINYRESDDCDMVRVYDDTGRNYGFYDYRFELYEKIELKKEVW